MVIPNQQQQLLLIEPQVYLYSSPVLATAGQWGEPVKTLAESCRSGSTLAHRQADCRSRPSSAVVTLAARGNVVERLAVRQAEQDSAVARDTAHHPHAAKQRDATHLPLADGIGAVDELSLVESKDDQRFALGNSTDGLDDEDRELRVDHDSQYDKHDEQNADGLPSHEIPLSVVPERIMTRLKPRGRPKGPHFDLTTWPNYTAYSRRPRPPHVRKRSCLSQETVYLLGYWPAALRGLNEHGHKAPSSYKVDRKSVV